MSAPARRRAAVAHIRREEATMSAPQGTVRAHRQGATLTLQPEGQASMRQCPALRQFAERALAEGVESVRVDLRRCTHMDSTFLGTLLALKRLIDGRGSGELLLVSPSPQCCRLLRGMGLARFYPTVTADELPPDAWEDLPGTTEDVAAFKQTVVDAHRELANIAGPAGEPFRAVARCIENDK